MTTQLEQAWEIAKQRYAAVGVDVEEAHAPAGPSARLHALLAG